MFTWIKIGGARQLQIERREKQAHILKGFSLQFFFCFKF